MRKWMICLLLLLLTVLSGCEMVINDVTSFRSAINNFDVHDTTGYYFKTTQYESETILNEDTIDLRIDWENLKMYTLFYEKHLNAFHSDKVFGERAYTTYFYDNQIGYQEDESAVTWQAGALEQYTAAKLPIKPDGLFAKQFETYEVIKGETTKTITGRMKSPKALLDFSADIEYLDLIIIINNDSTIVSIELTIQLSTTRIQMVFEAYYEPQVIIIP